MWDNADRAAAYTFSNRCDEDLIVTPANGGEAVPLPARATRAVPSVDQDPRQAFVVSRPDGSNARQVVPGMSVFAIEEDTCPSDH